MNESINLKYETKRFKRIINAVFFLYIASQFIVIIPAFVLGAIIPNATNYLYYIQYLSVIIGLYFIGFPIFKIMMKKIHKENIEKTYKPFNIKQIIIYIIISFGIMYILNLITNIFMLLINTIFHLNTSSAGEIVSNAPLLANFIYIVIIAPFMEELMFRKILCDYLQPYDDLLVIIFTSLLFSFFHGNLSQLLYAFGLGFVLAYVYLKHHNYLLNVGLHMIINFVGSIIMPLIKNEIFVSIYVIIMITLGLILLYLNRKKINFNKGIINIPLKAQLKCALKNSSFILITIYTIAVCIMTLFAI